MSDLPNDERVIALNAFERGPGNRILAGLTGYWDALRAGGEVPTRAQIDPRGIESALEYAFIVERVAPGLARFRLAGAHLNDLMGMEVRGMPLSAMIAPASRSRFADALEGCFVGPEIVEITLHGETGIGKPAIAAKMVLLPLKSDLGDVNRALGAIVSSAPIGRTPRRFDVVAVRQTLVQTQTPLFSDEMRPLMPAIDRRRPAPAMAPGFAEARAPYESGLKRRLAERAAACAAASATAAEAAQGRPVLPAAPDAPAQMTPEARRAMMRLVHSSD